MTTRNPAACRLNPTERTLAMGYAHYTIMRNGEQIEAGYGFEATCEQDGCTAAIDRGLGYLCGTQPGGDETGCGGYFCGDHLYLAGSDEDERESQLCGACTEKAEPKQYTHAEQFDANGNPTGYALCDQSDREGFPVFTGSGTLAHHSGDATCETCIAILNGDLPHPNDIQDAAAREQR